MDPDENDKRFFDIRNKLYRLSLKYSSKIDEIKSKIDINELKNRDKNIWQPIIVLGAFFDSIVDTKIDTKCEGNEGNEANEGKNGIVTYNFAKNQQEIKKIEVVSSKSNEYKILTKLGDFLAKDSVAYLKEFSDELNLDNKTIAKHLDKMGFRDFKAHKRKGTCYVLNFDTYLEIAEPILGKHTSSPSSFPSHNNNNIDDKTTINNVKLCEGNEGNIHNRILLLLKMYDEGLDSEFIIGRIGEEHREEVDKTLKKLSYEGDIVEHKPSFWRII